MCKYFPKTNEELKALCAFKNQEDISLADIDTSKITDMSSLFKGTKRTNFDGIETWNVSNVTNMKSMFFYAKTFNSDISKWDVSNVADMQSMFSMAESFNQPIGSWDVSSVENMSHMFSRAKSFNADISKWNVSNVTDMQSMFSSAESFNQPIGSWDVSNVADMQRMFCSAESFNQSIGSWDVSNVTDMQSMFHSAKSFNQPIGSWDVSNVTDMQRMFWKAEAFDCNLGDWNMSAIDNISMMFTGALRFSGKGLAKWDVSRIKTAFLAFAGTNFSENISHWNLKHCNKAAFMFANIQPLPACIRNIDFAVDCDKRGIFFNSEFADLDFQPPYRSLDSLSDSHKNVFEVINDYGPPDQELLFAMLPGENSLIWPYE